MRWEEELAWHAAGRLQTRCTAALPGGDMAAVEAITFGRATTPEEVEAVQRLRFEVYVGELGRYRSKADDGRFAEPEDDSSWLFYARGRRDGRDGSPDVGGRDFSARQIEQFSPSRSSMRFRRNACSSANGWPSNHRFAVPMGRRAHAIGVPVR